MSTDKDFGFGASFKLAAPVLDLGSSPAKEPNPKDIVARGKLDMTLVPDSLIAYAATAFTEGALKYGSYNWRVAPVQASVYLGALDRHVKKWKNGEEFDPKTKVHHLANAIACLAIILDAKLVGTLIDNRPPKADMPGLIEELEKTIVHLQEMSKGLHPKHNYATDANI